MPSIEGAVIRKILDSRGNLTVEVEIRFGKAIGRAAAPSGASTGAHEPPAWPKGGVDKAIQIFRSSIAGRMKGRDVADQPGLDRLLREIDGTSDFEKIGANVATATSLASAKVAAASAGKPLYRYLAGSGRPGLPLPLGNVIGGGRHAVGGTTVQGFMVVSQGRTVSASVFTNARVHGLVRDALAEELPDAALGRGDEGAWGAKLADEEALALLANVCREASKGAGFAVQPALDLAASEFFRNGQYRYRERTIPPEEQVDFVERLVRDYGLFSVEDPFDQEDFGAFADLTRRIGDRCKVIGDDIFVTNVERLRRGIELRAGNAILIKPNQVGKLSEPLADVDLAHKSGFATVMSHRSGETTDDTSAHLAVAFGCLGMETGAVGGGRVAR